MLNLFIIINGDNGKQIIGIYDIQRVYMSFDYINEIK